MHNTASTSREHFKTFDARGLYELIMIKLREDAGRDWCIADLAHALGLERSTISARLNELKHSGVLEYTGKKRSARTQIMSMHFKLKVQQSLF